MPNASGVERDAHSTIDVRARARSASAETAFVLTGFTLLSLAATYPLVRTIATHLPGDLGDPVMNTWLLAWDASRIRHGLAGLWDAPNFFPYRHTLAYSDHLLGLAIWTAPLQWVTDNPVLVHNIAFVASFALSAAGMYVLARSLTGRRDAAAIAAAIYGFTPYRMSQLAHVQMLMSPWLPLSLWALHRYFSTHALRHLLASTAFFLLQALTAGYFLYFAALPLALAGIDGIVRTRPEPRRFVIHAAIAAAIMGAVLAPVAAAYYAVRHDYGLRRSSEEIVGLSADVRDYFSAPPRVRIWRAVATDRNEHNLFPGVMALVLSAVALATRHRDSTVRLYGSIAAVAFVLSLGPSPAAWGSRLPFAGPYQWLLHVVPGLDGLRVVARLDFIVILALAVLAAVGAARLFHRAGPRRGAGVFAVCLLACVVDGWAAPIPTVAFEPIRNAAEREAYAYLESVPTGAVLELPIALEDDGRNFRYQYLTLVHGHRIVNGHSGYYPPLLTFLGGGHSPLSETDRFGDVLDMLRRIGVGHVVLHLAEFDNHAAADAMLRTVDARPDLVIAQRRFDNIVVASLAPAPPPAAAGTTLRQLAPPAFAARASHGGDRVRFALDGDPDSRWLSGGRQTGGEWMELQLEAPRDIGLVRMQLAPRSFGDYPRELTIDAVEERGTRTLFDGPVLAQFVQGLIARGDYPFIDIVLPANHTRALRLQQRGQTNTFFWSIHELQLWER